MTVPRKMNLQVISLLVNGPVEFLDVIEPQLTALSDGRLADVIKATKNINLEDFAWTLEGCKEDGYVDANINYITYRCFNLPLIGCAGGLTAELQEQQTNNNKTLNTWLDICFCPMAGQGDCVSSYLRWLDFELD